MSVLRAKYDQIDAQKISCDGKTYVRLVQHNPGPGPNPVINIRAENPVAADQLLMNLRIYSANVEIIL